MEKSIATKCAFPLIKMGVNLRYAEVRKPTGVGYIALELIKNAKKRNERLTDIMTDFGVPEDLRFIFAGEVERLLNWGILRLVEIDEYKREDFNEYTTNHFQFTESGERIYHDGAIPTGVEKNKDTDIYFNPLTNEFSFKTSDKRPGIGNTNLYEADFMENIKTDLSGLNEFLIDNCIKAGLQKEERLLEHKIVESAITEEDDHLNLRIDDDGMEVDFRTGRIMDFYKNHFTPDMLTRNLAAKAKFRFIDSVLPVKTIGFSGFKNLSAVYPPEEYSKQLGRPAKLIVKRNDDNITVKYGKKETIFEQGKTVSKAIGAISPGWSFIMIDGKEMRVYSAVETTLTERRLNKPVTINLLVEQTFDEKQKCAVVNAIHEDCKASGSSGECCGLVERIFDLLGKAVEQDAARKPETARERSIRSKNTAKKRRAAKGGKNKQKGGRK